MEVTELPIDLLRSACGTNIGPYNDEISTRSASSAAYYFIAFTIFEGGCRKDVGQGATIVVPTGTARVDVDVLLPAGYKLGSRAAGGAGYAQANTDLGLYVQGPDVDQFDMLHSVISISPVLMVSSEERVTGPHVLSTSFVPRATGGSYNVYLYTGHFTLGIALLGGAGISDAEIPEIASLRALFVR